MKVTLISYTPNALDILVGTKTTRLRGKTPDQMTPEEKQEHWEYMQDTIKSSFEFVDYIFRIEGVSKNFTHQLVRTRTGSYQQEASRAIDLSDNKTVIPDALNEYQRELFISGVEDANAHYKALLSAGVHLQDARGILASNMETKITVKFNLRTMHDTSKLRLCARAQGEYQKVFRAMREEVIKVHPWAEDAIQVHCVQVGTCAFPRWGGAIMSPPPIGDEKPNVVYQCPHYDPRMNLNELRAETKIKFWSHKEIAEANPVATDGKAQ
jgi:flavin-dependent thymidylate synthase